MSGDNEQFGFFALALSRDVVSTAVKVCLTVGTILVVINHLPAILQGSVSKASFLQMLLTYFVPYGVSTYSSVRAIQKRSLESKD